MNGPDASSGEMPGFLFSRRPAPELDESLLDALLAGQSLPLDAPEPARAVADMLASLADPPSPGALAGEYAARAAFARAASPVGISPPVRRSPRHLPGWLPAPLTARLAAALVAVTVGLGGAAVAAYAGVLPGPIQDLAHRTIGAPAAHRGPPHANPGSRHAASSLCSGDGHAKAHSGPAALGAGVGKPVGVTGGAGKVDANCAAVAPGARSAAHGKPARGGNSGSHGKGKIHGKPKPHARPKHPAGPVHSVRPMPARL